MKEKELIHCTIGTADFAAEFVDELPLEEQIDLYEQVMEKIEEA